MADLVTGDAVRVDLPLAGLPTRLLAVLVDYVVQGVVLTAGAFALTPLFDRIDDALAAAVGLVLTVAVVIGYPVAMETLARGRSLGKLVLGLRVLGDDGSPERFRQALVRALLGIVEVIALPFVALFVALFSPRSQRVGDLLAGTVVVRTRLAVPHVAAAPAMPPGLHAWASRLDLSHLSDELALSVRQYLTRWHDLAPGSREEFGLRLATAVAQQVRPEPPPGVPPVAYLAAVLAERHAREVRRLLPPPAPWPGSVSPVGMYAPPPAAYPASPYAPAAPQAPQPVAAPPPPPSPPTRAGGGFTPPS